MYYIVVPNILLVVNPFRCVKFLSFIANCEVTYLFSTYEPRLSRFIFPHNDSIQRPILPATGRHLSNHKSQSCFYSGLEGIWGSGGIAQFTLNVSTKRMWAVSFTPRLLYPEENVPDTHSRGGWLDPILHCKCRSRRISLVTAGNRSAFPVSFSP